MDSFIHRPEQNLSSRLVGFSGTWIAPNPNYKGGKQQAVVRETRRSTHKYGGVHDGQAFCGDLRTGGQSGTRSNNQSDSESDGGSNVGVDGESSSEAAESDADDA